MKKILAAAVTFILSIVAKAQDSTLQSANNYMFFPGNEITLPPGGTTILKLHQITNDNNPAQAVIEDEQWEVDGKSLSDQSAEEGHFKIALSLDMGNYTAPSKVPPHNPVVITLSFKPQGEKTKIILYCRIHIIDKENYFYLNSSNAPGGTMYELKESPIPSFRKSRETANYLNDQWNIGVNGFRKIEGDANSTQFMGIGISVVGNGTGTFKWSVNGNDKTGLKPPCNTATVTGFGEDGSPFQYTSSDCVPHGSDNCKLIALEGSTTISVFDKKNKIIKGFFSGTLVSPNHQSVHVSGAFSVSIQ